MKRDAGPTGSARAVAEAARFDRLLVAVCATVMVLLGAQILTFGYGRDQGIYAMVARALLAGGMPYRDAWDFKPPGVFLVYAVARAVFGASQAGIRVLEVGALALMARSMVRLARVAWGSPRAGWIAGAVAFIAHAELDFWHTAQPESFGGVATILALDVVVTTLARPRPRDREHLARWAIAGALFGFAGLLKPPLAGGGAVVALALTLRARSPRPALAIALGGTLPFALIAAWFGARGALGDLVDALFVFAPHYTALSWEGESLAGMLAWSVVVWLTAFSSVTPPGLLLFVASRRGARRDGGLAWICVGIVAVHLVGVALQGKFFAYHYGATWPVAALLAAAGYAWVFERAAARGGRLGVGAFFVAAAIVVSLRGAARDLPATFLARSWKRFELFVVGPRDQAAIDRLATVADVDAGVNRAVAAWIAARVPAGRPVLVWGFEPVIYDLADRAPASRYLYDVPQRVAWAQAASRDLLMRDLDRSPPAVVVVEHHDVFVVVTGDPADSAEALQGFDALRDLLADRYTFEASIENFDLYLEIEAPGEGSRPRVPR